MAKNKSTVHLGYEDEEITDKHKSLINYTTNKIGGLPDWSHSDIKVPNCPICNLNRPLLLQIYAPLENSQFHRTLYIFACLNPLCSVKSRGWICVRTQTIDKQDLESVISGKKSSGISAAVNISWCSGVDEWGDTDTAGWGSSAIEDENQNEENGNVINNTKNDNSRISDDDDESTENDIVNNFGNLNVDDKNANCGAQGGMGGLAYDNGLTVYAEIEGEESELVTMESPLAPERDLIALLKQTTGFPAKLNNLTLKSYFIFVDEEKVNCVNNYLGLSDHVRELIQEYQLHDDICKMNPESPISAFGSVSGCDSGNGIGEQENYEKAAPAHGDIMFHNFMSVLQNNPGQIMRYSRDTFPLLIAPLTENIPKCQSCGSECICEVQILPTIIPKLKLENSDPAPIEFGNVLIFTCLKSCWDTPDKMRFENIIVQQEI